MAAAPQDEAKDAYWISRRHRTAAAVHARRDPRRLQHPRRPALGPRTGVSPSNALTVLDNHPMAVDRAGRTGSPDPPRRRRLRRADLHPERRPCPRCGGSRPRHGRHRLRPPDQWFDAEAVHRRRHRHPVRDRRSDSTIRSTPFFAACTGTCSAPRTGSAPCSPGHRLDPPFTLALRRTGPHQTPARQLVREGGRHGGHPPRRHPVPLADGSLLGQGGRRHVFDNMSVDRVRGPEGRGEPGSRSRRRAASMTPGRTSRTR